MIIDVVFHLFIIGKKEPPQSLEKILSFSNVYLAFYSRKLSIRAQNDSPIHQKPFIVYIFKGKLEATNRV